MRDEVKLAGDAVIAAVKQHVAESHKALAEGQDRLITKCDAVDRHVLDLTAAAQAQVAMAQAQVAAGAAQTAELAATIKALPPSDYPKLAAAYESLERRASRQAEHLAALESRMQVLERTSPQPSPKGNGGMMYLAGEGAGAGGGGGGGKAS